MLASEQPPASYGYQTPPLLSSGSNPGIQSMYSNGPPPTAITATPQLNHQSSNSSTIVSTPHSSNSPVNSNFSNVSSPGSRTFSESLHDHFDLVFKRATMGRRDVKTIRSYFESRAECEKAYATRLIKDAGACADLTDSSSTIPAWKDVKETSIQLGTVHSQIAALCSELATLLKKVIEEEKSSKTQQQNRFDKITEDCERKLNKHNKARESYADSVKQAENAIQQRDAGKSFPPPKQQQLQTAVGSKLNQMNNKHEEYKKSIHILQEAQTHYDATMIEIMNQMEKTELERLRVLQDILNRFASQHDSVQQSLGVIAQQLHRSISAINNSKDVQDFINLTTTNTKPKPHIEYHAIESAIITQNGGRVSTPETGVNTPNQIPGQLVAGQSYPPTQGNYGQPAGYGSQPSGVPAAPQHYESIPANLAGGIGAAKFIPPPVVDRFVPPSAPTALALYDFEGHEADDLSFKAGDVIQLKLYDDKEDWWNGELRGKVGIFPKNYVQKQEVAVAAAPPSNPVVSAPVSAGPVNPVYQQPVTQQYTAAAPISMSAAPVDHGEGIPHTAASSVVPSANGDASAASPVAPGSGTPEQPIEMNAICEALFDFVGQDADELSFHKGDTLVITGELNGWYLGKIQGSSQVGIFPSNYVSVFPA